MNRGRLYTIIMTVISLLTLSGSVAPSGEEPFRFHKFYLEYGGSDKAGWGWIRPGDMDSDGDIDLVAGGGRRLFVYENDGRARGWKPYGNLDPTGEIGSNGGVLFDVDRDGDLDVVSAR
ncbi:FG-GAP repeat domain-containing protein, partial [Gemmatimonadota bacterium]